MKFLFAYKQKFRALLQKTVSYNAKVERLLQNALCSNESGVDEKSDLIVSLTTFGKYIYDAHIAIESLLEQTVKPKKIILWISDKISDDEIPQILRLQERRGLEIKKTRDIRSYKKLIPALKEFPKNPIITFDDDCIYPYDAVESLFREYKKNPNLIYYRCGRRMALLENQKFVPYKNMSKDFFSDASFLNFPVGCGGVLYPPNCFDSEIFCEEVFEKICPTADDIWFKAMSLKRGVLCKAVRLYNSPYMDLDIFFENQAERLNSLNVDKDANDLQIKAVWDKYDLWEKMSLPPKNAGGGGGIIEENF